MKSKLKKFIQFLEKDRVNFTGIFIYVIIVGILRRFFEEFFVYRRLTYDISGFGNHISFFLFMFLGGTLIISHATKVRIKKVMNLVIFGFWITTLAPIFDAFIFHMPPAYQYLLPGQILEAFTSLSLEAGISKGVVTTIAMMFFPTVAYSYIKTNSIKRTIYLIFLIYSFFMIAGGQPYMSILLEYKIALTGGLNSFLPSLPLALIIIYRENKKLTLNIIKSLFEIRTLYFVFFVIGGIILSQSFEDIFISLTPILLKVLSIVFVWQFTLGLNNIYDVKIDSKKIETKNPLALGAITKKGYFDLITIYLINALFLSVLLGFTYFGLIIAFAFAGFIYSVPPLRMRNRMFSTLFIGIGSVIAFLVGFGNIFVPREILIILFVILFGTSLGTTVKDLRDYESEKGKIKNLFTVYGKRKGKKIASILLLLSFLSPLLIFNNSLDIVFFSLFAFLSVLIFQKKEDYRFILILFFIIFVYSMFRII